MSAASAVTTRFVDAAQRHSRAFGTAVAVGLAIVASARVVGTFRVFSATMDEPAHIAAGLEWLERGTFGFGGEHPPLGRVAAALGPYLDGVRLNGRNELEIAMRQILFENGGYVHNLFLARLGMLVFFLVAIAGVLVWTDRLYGGPAALVAGVLFTTTPTVLAHAGLATTDMPLLAMLLWTVFALTAFVERPSIVRGAGVGLATGLALVAKMSSLLFVPTAFVTIVIARLAFGRRQSSDAAVAAQADGQASTRLRVALGLGLAACIALLVVWATYRFTVGRRFASVIPGGVIVLAPDYFASIGALVRHNAGGHAGYSLGEFRTNGWWYFFPFALSVKTPIPLLLLTVLGALAVARRAWATREWRLVVPIAVAAAIVLASMPTTINIGVRHVLAIYPLLAMTAAYGCVELWRQTRWRAVAPSVAAGLVAWQVVEAARAHPDYLPYFNDFAGRHPERLLLDSDLDWGQDLLRLADTVRVSRIRDITVAYYGSTDMRRMIPADAHFLRPYEPVTGWLAVSETYLANPNPEFAGYRWVRTLTPVAQVGKSIKLFYVPPRANALRDGSGAPAPRADAARSRASP